MYGTIKTQYDKHTRPKKLIVGEQLLLLQPNKQNILQTQWEGRYQIVEIVYENNYKLKIKANLKVCHANWLKKFIEREDESTSD